MQFSKILRKENAKVMDNTAANATTTILANVKNIVPVNSDNNKIIKTWTGLSYFAHVFISDHITIDDRHYLLP